jgi:hypothetical protein
MTEQEAAPDNVIPLIHIDAVEPRWTRFDEALAEELLQLDRKTNVQQLLLIFDKSHEKLSDAAFWFLLGVIWSRNALMTHNALWLKHFASKRPHRRLFLMKDEELDEYTVLHVHDTVVAYRPQVQVGGLHPFIFCLDEKTAYRHAQELGSGCIGTFVIPTSAVVAFFDRLRGPELLVIDCSEVKLENIRSVKCLTF